MKKYLFISVIMILAQCFSIGAEDEDADPIEVSLATDSQLQPLYLGAIFNEDDGFNDSYVKQLEKILAFDLGHNGSTLLVKHADQADQWLSSGAFEQVGSLSNWKNQNIKFVIKSKIKDHKISVLIVNIFDQGIKSIDSLPLSGDLSDDRQQIHKIADIIHKALFDVDGVASTKILYSLKIPTPNGKGISEIWESDYDGANAHQLTKGGYYNISPTYLSPKPGYLTGGFMWVSYQIGQPKIYVASLKDPTPVRLTLVKGNQFMPAVSRQRDKVAFICDVTGNPDLFIQPFSQEKGALGKPYQIYSAKKATQGTPTFSPDGKKLAFVSDKDGSPKVYVIDIPEPGTSLKNVKAVLISKQNRENSAPNWSPDGKKLAYCARSGGARQIWIYDFETNKEKQVTKGATNKENPFWAPNSTHLVFNTSETNASDLFLININQADATQITFGKGEKRFPSWEPRF